MLIPLNSKHVELANRLRALKASVSNEASLIKVVMQNDIVKSNEGASTVAGRYADEFAQLWAWQSHLEKLIENECSDLPPVETVEPAGECMPRSRRGIAQPLREELDDSTGALDPLFGIIAELCGAAVVLSIGKTSKVDGLRIAMQNEVKKRLQPLGAGTPPPPASPPPRGGGGSVVTGAILAKAKGPQPGKKARKATE